MANDSCNARPAQGPKRMQGTARGRCFRFPHERPNEHSPYRMANDSCNARPAQGPKRMQGTARGRCFRFPHERPNEHSPYRMANDSCNARPAQGPKRMQGTARGHCFCFPHERPNEHSPFSIMCRRTNESCSTSSISLRLAIRRGCTQTNYDRSGFSFHIITADSPETTCSGLSSVFSALQN